MSDLVGNPEDRFSHNKAQISSNTHLIYSSELGLVVSKLKTLFIYYSSNFHVLKYIDHNYSSNFHVLKYTDDFCWKIGRSFCFENASHNFPNK